MSANITPTGCRKGRSRARNMTLLERGPESRGNRPNEHRSVTNLQQSVLKITRFRKSMTEYTIYPERVRVSLLTMIH